MPHALSRPMLDTAVRNRSYLSIADRALSLSQNSASVFAPPLSTFTCGAFPCGSQLHISTAQLKSTQVGHISLAWLTPLMAIQQNVTLLQSMNLFFWAAVKGSGRHRRSLASTPSKTRRQEERSAFCNSRKYNKPVQGKQQRGKSPL